MEFPFHGGCLYPLRDFFNKPLKGGVKFSTLLLWTFSTTLSRGVGFQAVE